MLVKRRRRKAAEYNSLITSSGSCMIVDETGGRRCDRCGGQPQILHVPYRPGAGAFCVGCCPCSKTVEAEPTGGR